MIARILKRLGYVRKADYDAVAEHWAGRANGAHRLLAEAKDAHANEMRAVRAAEVEARNEAAKLRGELLAVRQGSRP